MHESAVVEDLNEHLDDLGEQILFKLYTQICLCFSLPDTVSDSATIDMLTNGLERLSASFPWLAGQVVREGLGEGVFKIKPLEKIPRLVVKDHRNDPSIPTMEALRQASFPFGMLDESIIAPCNTLPESSNGSATEPVPVFLLQANFIVGGLLLTFVALHNTMDMTGQGQVMRLFSKACRNEPFTSEELSSGNLARSNLIPLLDDSYQQGPELAHQIVKPNSSHTIPNDTHPLEAPSPAPKCLWTYFTFHPTSLQTLKALAAKTITFPPGYISTDDTLSAFIWQSVIRARLPRLTPTTESKLARAVDVRRYLDIPQNYPGMIQNMTYHTDTLQQLIETPLGAVASQLRSAVDPKTSSLAYNTRALVTFLNRAPDKKGISFTATVDPSVDVMLSSWAKVDCCGLDFNLGLGQPEAVRRPRFEPFESLIYLMPKALDGEIAAAVCLRNEDMERLKSDEQFATYAKYVG